MGEGRFDIILGKKFSCKIGLSNILGKNARSKWMDSLKDTIGEFNVLREHCISHIV